MSNQSSADKSMSNKEAMRVVREMLKQDPSCLILRKHCQDRMKKRGLNHRDILNTLLGGKCTGIGEHIKSGLDVYRFETNIYRVECNIFSYENIVVITAIRKYK